MGLKPLILSTIIFHVVWAEARGMYRYFIYFLLGVNLNFMELNELDDEIQAFSLDLMDLQDLR